MKFWHRNILMMAMVQRRTPSSVLFKVGIFDLKTACLWQLDIAICDFKLGFWPQKLDRIADVKILDIGKHAIPASIKVLPLFLYTAKDKTVESFQKDRRFPLYPSKEKAKG